VSGTTAVRWGVPIAIAVAGFILAVTVSEGAGEGIVGAAACVALGTWFLRFSFSDAADREREEDARRYFDEHGRWPDEDS
jgi:hypothetical protein